MQNYRIFLDLDGVIVNLQKRVFEISGKAPEVWDNAFWDMIPDKSKLFTDLEPFEGYKSLLEICSEISCDGKVRVLTAIPKLKRGIVDATSQKMQWVNRHFHVPYIFNIGPYSEDKWKHCQYTTDILIDDMERNILDWERNAGGMGIHHISIEKTIERLKQLC
jgi:hypothetical protein